MLLQYPLSALMTPIPVIPFTTKEITGCTAETAKGADKSAINPHCFSFYVILCCFSNSIH